jgi:uncharacterized protein (TIGR00251 family)
MVPVIKKSDGVILKIYVQPKSSKNEIAGIHDNAVKIRLTAPPVDNAANEMCIKFLAKTLGIPKSSMDIISGHSSRHKQIFIRVPTAAANTETLLNRIENHIQIKKP